MACARDDPRGRTRHGWGSTKRPTEVGLGRVAGFQIASWVDLRRDERRAIVSCAWGSIPLRGQRRLKTHCAHGLTSGVFEGGREGTTGGDGAHPTSTDREAVARSHPVNVGRSGGGGVGFRGYSSPRTPRTGCGVAMDTGRAVRPAKPRFLRDHTGNPHRLTLIHRVADVALRLPALQDRAEDISLLAVHFPRVRGAVPAESGLRPLVAHSCARQCA